MDELKCILLNERSQDEQLHIIPTLWLSVKGKIRKRVNKSVTNRFGRDRSGGELDKYITGNLQAFHRYCGFDSRWTE